MLGGEGGIRTHGTVAGTIVFKTISIDHSDTSPEHATCLVKWTFLERYAWRRERDSNPRGGLLPPIDLANRPLQPLGYLSITEVIITQAAL
jgi:hypothetical protein